MIDVQTANLRDSGGSISVAAVPAIRTMGRIEWHPAPAHVRVIGLGLDEHDRERIEQTLARRFRRFAAAIERVTVRITDENGPKGGLDLLCAVKVVLRGLPSVVVERRHGRVITAVTSALQAAGHAVGRSLARRRVRPMRSRAFNPRHIVHEGDR